MKKIFYLVMIAFSLQSCLNDKENESDLFNSVGKDLSSISFGEAERLSKVDVFATKESELPVIGLGLKDTPQEFTIPVVLLTKPLDRDVVVTLKLVPANIDTYNASKVAEFNTLRAEYETLLGQYVIDKRIYDDAVTAGTPLPPLPVEPKAPKIILPYVSLPDAKYTISKTVTIAKGSRSADAVLTIPNALADFSLDFKYMLPITLEVTDPKVKVANPVSLIFIGTVPFNPYAGEFEYTGRFERESGPTTGFDVVEPVSTILEFVKSANGTGDAEMPVAGAGGFAVGQVFRMIVKFTPPNGNNPNGGIDILGPTGSLLAPVPVTALGQLPTSKPKLTFNLSGELVKIENFHYTYRNTAGLGRKFIMSSITRVE